MGIAQVVATLEQLEQRFGSRFAPCGRLKKMIEEQKTFYGPDVTLDSGGDSAS